MDHTETWVRDIDHDHPGVSSPRSQAICEAATVCLARHYEPPKPFALTCFGDPGRMVFRWEPPSQRARNAHANEHDATKEGAYAISLLCVQHRLGLVAVGEAKIGTGADWFVAPNGAGLDEFGAPNLDDPDVRRLEVSGQDTGPTGSRLRAKRRQLLKGDSDIPGIASVVGFRPAVVRIDHAAAPGEEL